MATRRGILKGLAGGIVMAAGGCTDGKERAGGGATPRGGESPAAGGGSAPAEKKAAAPAGSPDGGAATFGPIPTRPFGRASERVSIVGVGGYHIGVPSEEEAIRIVRRALDAGVNFLDNCWDYHAGKSETRMGKALRDGWRRKAFLMTKLDARPGPPAREQLEQSLRRLQTDVIDLVQVHEVIRDEDPAECFAPGAIMDVLAEAKQAGKVRYVGFTGHKHPRMHRAFIEAARARGYRLDAVQLPLNVLDAHFLSFEKEVVPLAVAGGIAVLGMKPLSSGGALQSGASAEECLRYAMSVPGVAVTITGCDSEKVLEQALRVASGFTPMGDDEKAALLARTEAAARDGRHEGFKTTGRYDGTEQNKHWLTTARP